MQTTVLTGDEEFFTNKLKKFAIKKNPAATGLQLNFLLFNHTKATNVALQAFFVHLLQFVTEQMVY